MELSKEIRSIFSFKRDGVTRQKNEVGEGGGGRECGGNYRFLPWTRNFNSLCSLLPRPGCLKGEECYPSDKSLSME